MSFFSSVACQEKSEHATPYKLLVYRSAVDKQPFADGCHATQPQGERLLAKERMHVDNLTAPQGNNGRSSDVDGSLYPSDTNLYHLASVVLKSCRIG